MRLGILKVDTVSPLLAPQFGEYSDMIIGALQRHGANFCYSVIDVEREVLPHDLDAFDGFIITGSKRSVYEEVDWIKALKAFVIEAHACDKILLGICFGHQVLASALGGRVEKSDKGWGLGLATFRIVHRAAWQKPALESVSLLMSHQDQVVALPTGAKLIATNDFCPIACFQLGEKVLGIQGHPEFDADYLYALMGIRLESIGEQRVSEAKVKLFDVNDSSTVARWIIRFIGSSGATRLF